MLHNDVAQQRPGEKPASAPNTSQKLPRAQTPAKFKIPTLKHAGSRHKDIDAAGLRDGNMETTRIIYIHGGHSPPTQMQSTTHTTRQLPQHPKDPTKIPQYAPKFPPQPARNHSLGEGHVHARSVFGPEHGAEQQQLPRLETETMLQHSPSLTKSVHHKSTPLPQPARNHSTAAGNSDCAVGRT